MATGRLMGWASGGALAVCLLAGCGGSLSQAPKPAVAPAPATVEISDVQVSGKGDAVQVTVVASGKVSYSLVRQSKPPRLNLQIAGAKLAAQEKTIPVNRGAVSVVKATSSGANSIVEVLLSGEALYDVEGRGTSVVMNVTPKAPAPPAQVEKVEAAPPAAEQTPAEPAPAAMAAPAETPAATPEPPAAAPVPVAAPASGPPVLTAIDVKPGTDGLVVTLQGNGPLRHEYFLVEGKSLVVDIPGAKNKVWPMKRKVGDARVSQIRIGEHEQPKRYVRVVFDLKKLAEFHVAGSGDGIVVSFGAPALAAAAAASGGETDKVVTALNTVGDASCRAHNSGTRLEIPTAVKPDYTIVDSGDAAKVIVEIANARVVGKDAKTVDLAAADLAVVSLTVAPFTKGDQKLVRVVAQLRRPTTFRAVAENNRILVDFEKPAAPVAAAPVADAVTVRVDTPVVAKAAAATPAAPAAQAPAAAGKPTEPQSPAAPEAPAAAPPEFTGRRLSLDFKDADVNDILRLISEVATLNFVAGPEVKGTVSIKLTDVPWDLALDLILKTNIPQLAQVPVSENTIRITTSDKMLDDEQRRRRIEEDKKKTSDAQKALEPLISKTFSISYIEKEKMSEFVSKLEKFKSKRDDANIQFDERTKNVIVWDTVQKMREIEQVILTWDSPTPAVLVEARIVEVTSNFGQSVGIQWNASAVKDAAHGNATPYAFPNSVSVGGQQQPGATGPGNYLVNLPATVATGGVGMSFGHIANTLSLDLRLSAGENMGKVKILSNPKVLVVQNQEARINLGSELPVISTDSAGARTVTWRPVGVSLDVKPQITNDKRVFMNIKVEKSSQGPDVQTGEGLMFSLNTSKAETKVLIADGETTVIGGIFIEESSGAEDSIPGLAKIPIVGWLFKNKTTKENRRELMIFLTPRIVVM